jgi:hypothetical protein
MGSLTLERPVTAGTEEVQVTRVQDAPAALRPNTPVTAETVIDGAAVLDEARAFMARFVIASSPAVLDAMTLWAAHTWAVDPATEELAWSTTPRIAFISDEPESGKTAHMEMMGLISRKAELTPDATGASMCKGIRERHPVYMVDETDLLFGAGAAAKSVRTVLNSGYRKGACIDRVAGLQSTFSAAAVAGLASSFMGNASLKPTRTRCVIVWCAPPPPGVKRERYRDKLHEALGLATGEALGEWVASRVTDMITTWPDLEEDFGEELDGRVLDIWEPLVAVADTAGGDWPARARAACREFVMGDTDRAPVGTPRMRLLADIRSAWPEGADRMASADLTSALLALEGQPWASMWNPVSALREIPALTGIAPVKVKLDGRAVQGYYRSDFEPLWSGNETEEVCEQAE